jgi:hypothetical protein
MSKIMKKQPTAWRGPVRINDSKYAIWVSIPLKLGEINKSGIYWVTPDNMRFVSSRDAAEYMLKMYEVDQGNVNLADLLKHSRQAPERKSKEKKALGSELKTQEVPKSNQTKQVIASGILDKKVVPKTLETKPSETIPSVQTQPTPVLQPAATVAGKPNKAVTSRAVKMQQLLDSVNELKKEMEARGEL